MKDQINKQCPKCGYDDVVMGFISIGTKYHSKDDNYELVKPYLGMEKSTEYVGTTAKIKKECVKIHCRTCQYAWVTDTAKQTDFNSTNAFGLNDKEIRTLEEQLQKAVDDEINKNKHFYSPHWSQPFHEKFFMDSTDYIPPFTYTTSKIEDVIDDIIHYPNRSRI